MTNNLKQPSAEPHDDPTEGQRSAANPRRHVWVRASAGSGKTTVLVNRVLRLLLPDPDTGAAGTPLEKILCITYTKAGATTMALRVQKKLLSWSVLAEPDLRADLTELLGADPDENTMRAAQQLFARVLDRPERLRIMTIHSFCQSVLARFPLETGLSPSMTVIDEFEARQLKLNAFEHVMADISESAALLRIPFDKGREIILSCLSAPHRLQIIFDHYARVEDIKSAYQKLYGLNDDCLKNPSLWFVDFTAKDMDIIRQMSKRFRDMKTDPAIRRADKMIYSLDMSISERAQTINDIIKIFSDSPRHKALIDDPDFMQAFDYLQNKIGHYRLATEINLTVNCVAAAQKVLKQYQLLKRQQNALDYNDLIAMTRRLLRSSFSWVHYKLDGGIDHILLDESQDTSPEQWDIIRELTTEIISGSDENRPRSLFVVGDEKQSIFSFQGADPKVFGEMLDYFEKKITPFQDGLEESMIFSFRSTEPVLHLVDDVFTPPDMRKTIGLKETGSPLLHRSFRKEKQNDNSGCIELFLETMSPPDKSQNQKQDMYSWRNVFDITDQGNIDTAEKRLLNKIVMRVKNEISAGHWRPEDIMILFRSRTEAMNNLIKMLKWAGIPVSGMDRLVLNDHIVIKDLMALAQFALMPEDDFSLACFLKSPFIGFTEDQLYVAAAERDQGKTIWHNMQDLEWAEPAVTWLKSVMEMATAQTATPVYEWLTHILIAPCPADPDGSGYRACTRRFGAEIMDPLDEILGDALRLELQNIRTLRDFITRFAGGDREIKRELSEQKGEVRIMTVHAAKGLESRIVILPDTVTVPDHKKTPALLWQNIAGGLALPLVSFSKPRSAAFESLRADYLRDRLDEEKRLLYVALTRAEDMLIIGGAYKPTEKQPRPKDESWFHKVETAFNRMGIAETEQGLRRLGTPYIYKSKSSDGTIPAAVNFTMPAWLYREPPMVAAHQSVLNPSLAKKDQASRAERGTAIILPTQANNRTRFMRGNITHKLLQILPAVEPEKREAVAQSYLARGRFGLSEAMQAEILSETLTILNDPQFSKVFGANSMAEVPIMGQLPSGQYVSGQIDRLYISDDEILVVDYKTNRPSPDSETNIPEQYRAQMALYKELLAGLYPNRPIKTALLWTDKARFMPL